jgi:sec-independent protein translocase protein TatB
VFNVGIGEIAVIVLVCLVVFGPDRLPQIARQIGRFLGQLRLTTQGALDQLKQEADLKDVNLPDLRVGSLRAQARDYVRELLDIEGQMADLEREREQLKASLEATTEAVETQEAAAAGAQEAAAGAQEAAAGAQEAAAGAQVAAGEAHVAAAEARVDDVSEPAPVDPEAT